MTRKESDAEDDVTEKSDTSKTHEKSDADLDKEELDRVRQRFNAKKVSLQDKKKSTKLDMDDDEEEEEQTPAKMYVE